MKLKNIAEMASKVARQTDHFIELSAFQEFTKIGTIENYDFLMSASHGDKVLGKLIDKDGSDIAYILLQHISGLSTKKSPVRVRKTWVEPAWRNKGVMTSIYKNLAVKFKFAIISDIEFSPETESVWKKIYPELHPNIIDCNTGNIFKPTNFDDIFKDPKYSFIIEWVIHPIFEDDSTHYTVLGDLSVYINQTSTLP